MQEKDFFRQIHDLQLKDIENMYTKGIFTSGDYNQHGLYLKKGVISEVSAQKLIQLYNESVVIPYMRNRGMGVISKKHIDTICNELNPNHLGVLYVSEFPFGRLMLCDFHHRILAIIQYFTNNPNATDFNIKIELVSIFDALDTYRSLNTHLGHTTKNRLTNKDFAIGYMILPIIEQFNLSMSFSTHISNLCICYGIFKQDITYAKVYASRNKTLNKSNILGGEKEFFELTNLTVENFNAIKKAILLYIEFIRCLREKYIYEKDITIEFKSISKSVAFFSYFTTDCLRKDSVFTSFSIKKVADKLFPLLSKITPYLHTLIGKSDSIVQATAFQIDIFIQENLGF